jgi:hypothetical protein
MTAMGSSTQSPLLVPLGDRGKHQHFGAAENPARGEHGNKHRQNFGQCTRDIGLFHWFSPPAVHKLTAGTLAHAKAWALSFLKQRTTAMFDGWSWEELARVSSLAVMTVVLLISVAAVGAASEPARVPSKRI